MHTEENHQNSMGCVHQNSSTNQKWCTPKKFIKTPWRVCTKTHQQIKNGAHQRNLSKLHGGCAPKLINKSKMVHTKEIYQNSMGGVHQKLSWLYDWISHQLEVIPLDLTSARGYRTGSHISWRSYHWISHQLEVIPLDLTSAGGHTTGSHISWRSYHWISHQLEVIGLDLTSAGGYRTGSHISWRSYHWATLRPRIRIHSPVQSIINRLPFETGHLTWFHRGPV